MSKSLKRVLAETERLGLAIDPIRMEAGTLTAQQAAEAVDATVDQIVKSVILRAVDGGEHVLFLTSGTNYVDLDKASQVADMALEKADAASIRTHTGFAIGGVSPFGHLTPIRAWLDPHILTFETVWAAAGTPHHMFEIRSVVLQEKTGAEVAEFTA